MAFKSIKDFPESTSPSGEWFVLCDDGTGCYYKVKLKNLPGGGFTTTSSTTTAAGTTSTTTTRLTTSTTTTAVPASTTTSTTSSTSSTSTSSTTTSSTSSTTSSSTSSTTSTTTTIVYDPDAQAFMLATGIPNDGTIYYEGTPQQITGVGLWGAVNNLVDYLKNGPTPMWSKLKVIYPFIGGTAITHKFNLKNPADTDAAFRMMFAGGVVHNATGVTFNGSTGYGDTKFAIEDFTSTTNMSYGVYIRTQKNLSNGGFDFGVYLSVKSMIWASSRLFYPNFANIPQWAAYGATEPFGFIAGAIRGLSDVEAYRNGVSVSTGTTTNSDVPTNGQPWFLGAVNNNSGVPVDFADHNYAFAYLGDGLDDTEMTNLYNAVQAYQTTLGRAV